jgi:hypothetical protein
MPGTVIQDHHEPPPATVPDPTLGAGGPSPKRASRWVWVLLGVTFLVLGGAAAAAFMYFKLFRYERTAALHLPSNTVAAFRIEAADLLLFGPVREHIWPVLQERAKQGDGDGGEAATRLRLIEDKTGIDLEQDIREIVIATVDATGFVVLLGGPLEQGRVVEGMHEILSKEAPGEWSIDGEILLGPGQLAIGQADDGTVVIGTHRDVTESALGTSKAHKTLALPEAGAMSFAFTEPAIEGMSATAKALTGVETRLRASRVAGTMTLSSDPRLEITFTPRGGVPPDELRSDVDDLIKDARLLLYFAPDMAGEKQALKNATIELQGGNVVVHAAWPYEPLDKGSKRIADGLRTMFGAR